MGGILTFDIVEPLFTEPLLDFPSGKAGGLDQPVDLTPQHQVLKVKSGRANATVTHTSPWCCWYYHLTHWLPYLLFLGEGTLGVAGPQHCELLSRLVGVNGETQYFGRCQL